MFLVQPGVWHDTVWADRTWQADLWLEYGTAVAEVAEVIGVFPITRRRRYTAILPLSVTIRRPYNAEIPMSILIRSQIRVEMLMRRQIRRRFTESFTQKRLVINKEFKRLLRTVKEYMLEE